MTLPWDWTFSGSLLRSDCLTGDKLSWKCSIAAFGFRIFFGFRRSSFGFPGRSTIFLWPIVIATRCALLTRTASSPSPCRRFPSAHRVTRSSRGLKRRAGRFCKRLPRFRSSSTSGSFSSRQRAPTSLAHSSARRCGCGYEGSAAGRCREESGVRLRFKNRQWTVMNANDGTGKDFTARVDSAAFGPPSHLCRFM
jgi:hypothetical protein